jgi:hypothetical protein
MHIYPFLRVRKIIELVIREIRNLKKYIYPFLRAKKITKLVVRRNMRFFKKCIKNWGSLPFFNLKKTEKLLNIKKKYNI